MADAAARGILESRVGPYLCALNPSYPQESDQLARIITACENTPEAPEISPTVVGRRAITTLDLGGVGKVVVKHYQRGGLFKLVMKRSYLRISRSRAQDEFEYLARVRALGVSAPEPVGFVTRGGIFYRNWLLTREIPEAISLADWAARNGENLRVLSDKVIEQVGILIEARILHVDLHPGNVILDREQQLWLLDFDKAAQFKGKLNILRDMYLVRWRRAVLKHGLPEKLSEYVALGLRRNFEVN